MSVDEIGVSLVISRAIFADLELSDPGAYEVVDFGPGGRTWNRRVVVGSYQHGAKSVGEVLAPGLLTAIIRVYGTTWAEVRTRAQALMDALSQHAYTITATIDGVVDVYNCDAGDVTLVGSDSWQKHLLMSKQQEYQITIPYDPTGA